VRRKAVVSLLVAVFVIVAVVSLVFVTSYNAIIRGDARLNEASEEVERCLSERDDLITRIALIVRTYARTDTPLFGTLDAAQEAVRAAETPKAKLEATEPLTKALDDLLTYANENADLMASTEFQGMLAEVGRTTNELKEVRREYEAASRSFERATARFPGRLVAGPRLLNMDLPPRPATEPAAS